MTIHTLTSDFATAGQLKPADIQTIAAQGYKLIICNRLDDEEAGQTEFAVIADAARKAGIAAVHLPVQPGHITEDAISDFMAACATAQGPILAYCRSGSRSAALWGLMQARRGMPVQDILRIARTEGHPLDSLTSRLVNVGMLAGAA